MMRAALENFRCRIHAEDRKTLERTAETLFIGNDSLWCEVRMLNDLTEGMARENQKLKEAYEKSEAERESLIKENQRLTGVTSMRTNDLFGRSTEKTEDLLKCAAKGNGGEVKNPIDEDAAEDVPKSPGSEDVENMEEAEVRRLLREILGEKESKKKEKGRRDKYLSKLPLREEYRYDLDQFDIDYGHGWKIYAWKKIRTLERTRATSYQQITYFPLIETMDGRIVDPYMLEPLIEKSLVSPSLSASAFYDKYRMFLPYYRQENDPGRFGFPISRQTLSNWEIHICEELFMPVYYYLKELSKNFRYQHCDETPWMSILDSNGGGNKGYFWIHLSGELLEGFRILFASFETTRAASHLTEYFNGVGHPVFLTDDAYSGYYTAQKQFPDIITICGCLTHSRRRFVNAIRVMRLPKGKPLDDLKEIPEYKCILLIAGIYREENKLRHLSAVERLKARKEKVRSLFDSFIDYIKSINTDDPDVSDVFRDAVEYTLNHEQELRQFLNDGNIPIDNTACERQIRNVARLRVNSLFSFTKRGADASAVMITLVYTALLNDADPYYYLKYLMEELPKHLYQKPSEYVENMVPWCDRYREYEEKETQKSLNSIHPPEGNKKPDIKKLRAKKKARRNKAEQRKPCDEKIAG